MLRFALHDLPVYLNFDLVALLVVVGDVPPGQARFALPILQEDKSYLQAKIGSLCTEKWV